ncbi:hypothetical protein Tco_1131987 [Tanacetum coccineum]|uniref:Reverse transcriptase n=1 Tax=Tanacetum coccineum TaxID=301880 RepID=A0ABQ5JBS0_9ASTR
MVDRLKLDEDLMGIPCDPTRFRGMVGSLMYLTASRPGILYSLCACVLAYADAVMRDVEIREDVHREELRFLGDRLVKTGRIPKKQRRRPSQYRGRIHCNVWMIAQILWMRSLAKDYGFMFNKIPLLPPFNRKRSSIEGESVVNFNVECPLDSVNRVLGDKDAKEPNLQALTASADVPSSVTETH